MALDTWVPKLIVNKPEDQAGAVIDSTYWRGLWALVIEQGDDTADTLKDALDELFATAWHPTDGAAYISNPAIYDEGAETVQGQLDELLSHMDAAEAAILVETGRIDDLLDGTLDAYDSERLGGQLPAYYGTAAEIEDLQDQIDAIEAGTIGAFSHNDISTRDAADAHPQSAITGLVTALSNLNSAIPTTHAGFADKNDTASHIATAIQYAVGTSVAAKIAALEATIAGITGDIGELAHNDLASRDAAAAHPMSAITDLVAALAAKQATITGAATTIDTEDLTAGRALVSDGSGKIGVSAVTATELGYVDGVTSAIQTQLNAKQKAITAGTGDPSGGVDGDIYIKYA